MTNGSRTHPERTAVFAALPAAAGASFARRLSEVCTQFSDRTAIRSASQTVNFEQLYRRVCIGAAHLHDCGAVPGTRIGLMLDKSPELIYLMLAALTMEAVYVPLDPGYPAELLRRNITESGVALIVGDRHEFPRQVGSIVSSFALPSFDDERCTPRYGDPGREYQINPLAYVIFTSGSSGKQKAVGVPVQSLLASTDARTKFYGCEAALTNVLVSSVAFDSSVGVIYGSLFAGECLVLPELGQERDPNQLLDLMERQAVTSLLSLPSYVRVLIESASSATAFSRLKRLILAGEKVLQSDVDAVLARFPGIAVFNEYGPSESTVWTTVMPLSSGRGTGRNAPIGRQVSHVVTYVLDNELHAVPAGDQGELYIGGSALAVGYINDPGETAARFIPDPFAAETGARMYRTGDMVSLDADGNLTFIGRLDRQVKVSGYRVELGEIESAAMALEGVSDAAAVYGEDGSAGEIRLFVVTAKSEMHIRRQLEAALPRHMLPGCIETARALARLPNGKVDYSSLAASPSIQRSGIDPAQGALMEKVQAVWETVLRRPDLPVDADFFDVGGSSIKAAMIVNRLQRLLGLTLYVGPLFAQPTIRGATEYLKERIARSDSRQPAL